MKVWVASALALIVVAGGWVLYTYPPGEHTFYPRCVFKAATGIDCPGCGLTRASHQALHGHFGEAFRLNPLLFAMGFVALCSVPSAARGRMPGFFIRPWFGWTTVAVVVTWWIVRNL